MAAIAIAAALLLYLELAGRGDSRVLVISILTIGVLVIVSLLALWALLNRLDRIKRWIPHSFAPTLARVLSVSDALRMFAAQRKTLTVFFTLSLLEQLFPVGSLFLLARALGIPISPVEIFCIVTISLFAARIPVSISGIGIQEGIYVTM